MTLQEEMQSNRKSRVSGSAADHLTRENVQIFTNTYRCVFAEAGKNVHVLCAELLISHDSFIGSLFKYSGICEGREFVDAVSPRIVCVPHLLTIQAVHGLSIRLRTANKADVFMETWGQRQLAHSPVRPSSCSPRARTLDSP